MQFKKIVKFLFEVNLFISMMEVIQQKKSFTKIQIQKARKTQLIKNNDGVKQ